MRRLRPLCLTLASLALAAPSFVRADEPPGVVYDADGHAIAPKTIKDKRKARKAAADQAAAAHSPRLCAACASKLMQQGQMNVVAQSEVIETGKPTVVVTSGGAMASAGTCATCGNDHPVTISSAPGMAMVGEPAGGSAAPGLAYVGPTGGAEPTPVGVVKASYGPAGSASASIPGTASVGSAAPAGPGGVPYARPDEMPPSLFQSSSPRRKHILFHILGIPTGRRFAADQEAKARSAHAMISYGQGNSTPTELPASMVLGGK